MGYSADYDDAEQVAQGEEQGNSNLHAFEDFIEDNFGRDYGELSWSERSHASFLWKQHLKEHGLKA